MRHYVVTLPEPSERFTAALLGEAEGVACSFIPMGGGDWLVSVDAEASGVDCGTVRIATAEEVKTSGWKP